MLIGLNGALNSGKSTVANYLRVEHNFKVIAYADKLKESASELFAISRKSWDEWKRDPRYKVKIVFEDPLEGDIMLHELNTREFLQRYGTEAHRNIFGTNFWINATLGNLKHDKKRIVVHDARYENEIERIQQLGGVCVRVVNNKADNAFNPHDTEIPPPSHMIDYYLDNNGTKEQLFKNIDKLMEWMKEFENDEEYGIYDEDH